MPVWHPAAAVTTPRASRNLRVHCRKDPGAAHPVTRLQQTLPPATTARKVQGRACQATEVFSNLNINQSSQSIKPTPGLGVPLQCRVYATSPVQVYAGSGCPRSGVLRQPVQSPQGPLSSCSVTNFKMVKCGAQLGEGAPAPLAVRQESPTE